MGFVLVLGNRGERRYVISTWARLYTGARPAQWIECNSDPEIVWTAGILSLMNCKDIYIQQKLLQWLEFKFAFVHSILSNKWFWDTCFVGYLKYNLFFVLSIRDQWIKIDYWVLSWIVIFVRYTVDYSRKCHLSSTLLLLHKLFINICIKIINRYKFSEINLWFRITIYWSVYDL